MIRITQMKLPCGASYDDLCKKVVKQLRLKSSKNLKIEIVRHSIDARKKPQLFDIYTVDIRTGKTLESEQQLVKKLRDRNVSVVMGKKYRFPKPGDQPLEQRPVIIGAGPAGLFCALMLAKHGYKPLVLERGKSVDQRMKDIRNYWKNGKLNQASNVQFGEGGAGTFSDGKLNTQVNDRDGRSAMILHAFTDAGAPQDILFESLPHIGTDQLQKVIPAIRKKIVELGGKVRFESQVTSLILSDDETRSIKGVIVNGDEQIEASVVVLAPGHSARDTIQTLFDQGIPMQQKNFAIGFRVSHPQSMINLSQYGIDDPIKLEKLGLPSCSYKLTAKARSGRGVYSFCMCPGGYIVNASSEEGRIAVNGMSDYRRDSARANSAIVMTVGTEEFGSEHPLAGMQFQRSLEEKAYALGEGSIPVQRYEDLRDQFRGETNISVSEMEDLPEEDICIKGQWKWAPLQDLLPASLTNDFIEGMEYFDRKIHGFAGPEAIVAGVESRTSSPVRIPRNEELVSEIAGLYPCGEGAGYAGGIMSAAMDGVKVAEKIAAKYAPFAE